MQIFIYMDKLREKGKNMKEIRQKKDKGVSAIIATILLIAITVVLAATLVTILGGFTHGVSNSVVTVGATTQETGSSGSYNVYFNVSSSSTNLSASQVTLEINGASLGALSAPSGGTVGLTETSHSNFITGGSSFVFHTTSKVTALVLIYDGNTIYNSGSISVAP